MLNFEARLDKTNFYKSTDFQVQRLSSVSTWRIIYPTQILQVFPLIMLHLIHKILSCLTLSEFLPVQNQYLASACSDSGLNSNYFRLIGGCLIDRLNLFERKVICWGWQGEWSKDWKTVSDNVRVNLQVIFTGAFALSRTLRIPHNSAVSIQRRIFPLFRQLNVSNERRGVLNSLPCLKINN